MTEGFRILENLRLRITQQLGDYPQSGKLISKTNKNRRVLVIAENSVYYEIVPGPKQYIQVVRIKPRGAGYLR